MVNDSRRRRDADVNFDYLVDIGHYVVGDPDTVCEKLRDYYARAGGFGLLMLLAGKDYGTRAQRERDRILSASPEERARRAVVGDLFGHPHMRNNRESHLHEMRGLMRECAECRKSAFRRADENGERRS